MTLTDPELSSQEHDRIGVVHLGPSVSLSGGMGTAIRNYTSLPLGGYACTAVSTYRTDLSRVANVFWFLLRAPMIVVRAARADIIHLHVSERGSFVRKGLIVALARMVSVPFLVSVHGPDFVEWAPRWPRLVRWLLSPAALVLVLTTPAERVVRALCPRTEVERIDNFVEIPLAPPQMTRSGTPTVLFAGEIGTRKGVDVLIDAWSRIVPGTDAHLALAGQVAEPALLRSLPARVSYVGELSEAQVRDRLRAARVAVLPSRREAQPMFVLEAAAQARPVVATPVCDSSGVVTAGGMVVPADDPGRLAEALASLLVDVDLAERLGRSAWEFVRGRHSPEAAAEIMRERYERVSRGRGIGST